MYSYKGNACSMHDQITQLSALVLGHILAEGNVFHNLYFRVLHPVARNIKLEIIIPSFSQQLTKYFIMCPLYSLSTIILLFIV
jgi:hypothetical protein